MTTPRFVTDRLDALRRLRRHRDPPTLEGEGVFARVRGRDVVVFCSNDYLGLRCHPAIREGAAAAASRWGGGAGSSRLIAGSLPIHRALEEAVAAWMGTEDALVLTSGYHANLALIGAAGEAGDRLVSDGSNHASLIDGCRLAAAEVRRVPHGDAAAARAALQGRTGEGFLVGEGLYSMDGDRGPVAGWAAAAAAEAAWLIVDEAHAVGVLGPAGRGVCAEAGVDPWARVGTFGKALGAHGAFVATDAGTRDLVLNRGRAFVFTTGLAPAVAGAALAAVAIVGGEEGDERRERVRTSAARLRAGLLDQGLDVRGDAGQPIVPVVLGDEDRALEASAVLLDAGFLALAIRPPTVPEGTCRIRLTVSADHRPADIDRLISAWRGL